MFQKGIRPDSNGFVTIRSPLQIVKNPADFADFEMTKNVIQNALLLYSVLLDKKLGNCERYDKCEITGIIIVDIYSVDLRNLNNNDDNHRCNIYDLYDNHNNN